MKPEVWNEVLRIYADAMELPASEREDFARKESKGNEEVLNEVLRLLRAEQPPADFIDPPRTGPRPAGSKSEFSFFREMAGNLGMGEEGEQARPGDQIGDYELIELLASGGQGQVWAASQKSIGRRVALKIMLPERIGGVARELFMREARAGGRLSHPGIVTVFDQGTDRDHAWIAMELVEGGCTLRDSLDAVALGPLPPDYYKHAASIAAQMAEALQVAHEAGVIHRDVKPRNILVTKDDQVKITDFGLARITDEESLSKTGDFMGTYAYMSPEQIAARRAGIDHRTDIFSLGVVLYELLSLHRPFSGESTHEIADKILTAQPPELRTVAPQIPGDLRVICMKALEKSRRDRFQSMAELAAELRRFLRGEPIITRPPNALQRFRRFARRHPGARAVAITGAAAALVLYLVTRPAPAMPFTGPEYEQLILTQSPDDDDAPAFVGEDFLIFERRAAPSALPGLWIVDLNSALKAQAWSPEALACSAPAVSSDKQWLAHEEPSASEVDMTAIVVRRLSPASPRLEWPTTEHQRIEFEGASAGGVIWARTPRFVYTYEDEQGRALMLHDPRDPEGSDLELFHVAKRDSYDTDPFQVCFSPEEDQILIVDRDELHTLMLDGGILVETRTLDCGIARSPAWLDDGSIVLTHERTWEASPRMCLLTDGGLSRIRDLEGRLIGGHADLAVSPGSSMLALVDRVRRSDAFIANTADDTPTPVAFRFPPVHPVYAPDGRIVYSGDTGRGLRLNLYDPNTGSDRPLEVPLPFLEQRDDPYQLDQLGFSQNGERFVFRAKNERANNRCDSQQWIVIVPWPLGSGEIVAVSMEDRHITFPHVDDAGEQVVWYEVIDDKGRILGADVIDGELGGIRELQAGLEAPTRLSGMDNGSRGARAGGSFESWVGMESSSRRSMIPTGT